MAQEKPGLPPLGSGPEKVLRCGIKRQPGSLYYVSDQGELIQKTKGNPQKEILLSGIPMDPNWVYYLDGDGDISRKVPADHRPGSNRR